MTSSGAKSPAVARAERLKAALKANIARRKAQSRARAEEPGPQGRGEDVSPAGLPESGRGRPGGQGSSENE